MQTALLHKKTALVAVFFSLLVFQSAGWFVSWHTARQSARREAHAEMHHPESTLLRIVLPIPAFEKIHAGSDELRLAGKLYDIRAMRVQGDSVVLELYHDIREELLYTFLGSLLAPALQDRFDGPAAPLPFSQGLAKWLQSPFLLPEAPPLLASGPVLPPPAVFANTMTFSRGAPAPQGPPPKG